MLEEEEDGDERWAKTRARCLVKMSGQVLLEDPRKAVQEEEKEEESADKPKKKGGFMLVNADHHLRLLSCGEIQVDKIE